MNNEIQALSRHCGDPVVKLYIGASVVAFTSDGYGTTAVIMLTYVTKLRIQTLIIINFSHVW